MMNLTQKKCVACEGETTPLQGKELRGHLEEVEDWELVSPEREGNPSSSRQSGTRSGLFSPLNSNLAASNEVLQAKIKKKFEFKNFKEALAFVNKVGEIAEAEGHHPDVHLISYKNVVIELWTHAIGGLSENDFIVAAKINSIWSS